MNEVMQASEKRKLAAVTFVETVREHMAKTLQSYFKIGYELHKAQGAQLHKELGYDTLEELAEDCFGFSRSTMYDILTVYSNCRSRLNEAELDAMYEPYSFHQIVAMRRGCYSSPYTLIKGQRVQPTDSVRSISKYVSFFNKYTQKHSSYPSETLQEWQREEEERQELLNNSEQLEISFANEKKVQTSGQQECADDDSDEIEEEEEEIADTVDDAGDVPDEIEEEEEESADAVDVPDEIEEDEEESPEEPEKEIVSRETERLAYNFSTRKGIREFFANYEKWEAVPRFPNLGDSLYSFRFKNGMSIFASVSAACSNLETMKADCKAIRFFWRTGDTVNGETFEVTVRELERVIPLIKDEL